MGPGPAFDASPPGVASERESVSSSARRVPPEVTYWVAEEEKPEDVTGERSREKTSKVTLGNESGGVQRGVDVLRCAGGMHRRCGLMRAERSKGPEPCWQVPARERQESKSCAVKCTRLRHGGRADRGSRP